MMKWDNVIRSGWFQTVSLAVTLALLYFSFFGPKHIGSDYFEFTRVGWHEENFYIQTVDLRADEIRFVWKDGDGNRIASIGSWRDSLEKEGKQLVFAMNGGMYEKDGSPKGLFIEWGETRSEIDLLEEGYGNFYMQPNGVLFIIGQSKAGICKTSEFSTKESAYYATQSGPMLLIDGKINDQFRIGSDNKHIRNGVGLLEDGRLIFAMSKTKVNFHDFAYYFQQKECKNALYLDGFVSRMYAPDSEVDQLDGDFGVIIGVVK